MIPTPEEAAQECWYKHICPVKTAAMSIRTLEKYIRERDRLVRAERDAEWRQVIAADTEKHIAAVRAEERERCARIARNGCLVPPDGGSPTESERLMCEAIAEKIEMSEERTSHE